MEVQIHSSGAYRVEVFRKVPFLGFRPWIFGNPIYLADSIS
jgi:hypothetical protein